MTDWVMAGRLRSVFFHTLCGALALALWLSPAAALGGADGPPLRILAFGDSLVHGYGLAADETFPVQLERALQREGYRVEVLNGGNSGDTTAAGLARLDWALMDQPDLAIVEFGANDGLRGIDPAETYRNLDAILDRLKAADVDVLLTGMLAPRNLGGDYAQAFDAVFPRLAEAHGVAFYPFFLDGVAMQPELNQADGIHPNAAGVAMLVERILPSVVQLIDTHVEDAGDRNAGVADG
ncbi:MAG: arylesterase [Kiloniellales bacterium]|nr:arylesterase [Kiloniellales bacterium]